MSHQQGVDNPKIHELAWDAFMAGTAVAKEQGLYGAGQDLLKDAFSGNVRGLGPASCEMEFDERPNEPFLFFAADKTDPGAYNLPLYLGFADPMYCAGLLLSPKIAKGFTFTIMDVNLHRGRPDYRTERARGAVRYRLSAARQRTLCRRVGPQPGEQRDRGGGLDLAPAQYRGQIHGQGRPGRAGARAGQLPGHRRDPVALSHRPLRRGHDAWQP